MKHTLLACLLFVSGVVAGLVLTGRLQVTEESSARPAPEAVQPSTTAVPTVNLPNFSDVAAARIPVRSAAAHEPRFRGHRINRRLHPHKQPCSGECRCQSHSDSVG